MQDYLQTLWEKSGQTNEEVHSLQVSDIDHAGKLTVVEEANRMMDTRLDTISK